MKTIAAMSPIVCASSLADTKIYKSTVGIAALLSVMCIFIYDDGSTLTIVARLIHSGLLPLAMFDILSNPSLYKWIKRT